MSPTPPRMAASIRSAHEVSAGMAAALTSSVALAPGAAGAFADVSPPDVFG